VIIQPFFSREVSKLRRIILLATVAFVMAAAGAVTLVAAAPATAVPPERTQFPSTFEYVDEEICDFPIEFSFESTSTVTRFFDEQGNVTRIQAHFVDDAIATNPANGKSATGHEVANVVRDVQNGTQTYNGIPLHFSVPGYGAVLIDVGRVVFDLTTGEPTFIAGPHQSIEGDVGEFCAALA
jgi:hypothetical protein